jgi:hypothetical protein
MRKARNILRLPGLAPLAAWLPVIALALATDAAHPMASGATRACEAGPANAARRNENGLSLLPLDTFHRSEIGWEIYAPLAAHEIATRCGPATPAFAAALAVWQATRGLGRSPNSRNAVSDPDQSGIMSGVMDGATLSAMKALWDGRRPFVAASKHACPASPPEASLALVPPDESYGGKTMLLRPAALAAYGRMLAAARAEVPQVRTDPRMMTLFSAYRDPASDAARCAREGNCQGLVRATCSAHRTGLAIDLYLGAASGHPPDSSDDVNRLYLSRGAAYLWMTRNATRFDFVPYPFEPWHWEWTGEAI